KLGPGSGAFRARCHGAPSEIILAQADAPLLVFARLVKFERSLYKETSQAIKGEDDAASDKVAGMVAVGLCCGAARGGVGAKLEAQQADDDCGPGCARVQHGHDGEAAGGAPARAVGANGGGPE